MNRNLLAIQVMETAIDLPSDEQDAYVQSACDGDSTLLRKVRALLNAAEDETGFLATRSDYSDNEVPPPRERIGDYRIIREIGRGGMGIVYEAEHDAMQRRVALKVLSAGSSPSENQLARFYREARAAGQLHHTNIVPVFEVGSADDLHYYTMQFIEGANLDVVIDHVRELRKSGGAKSSPDLGRSVAQRLMADGSKSSPPKSNSSNGSSSTAHQSDDDRNARHHRFDSTDSVFGSSDWSSSSSGRDAYFRRVGAIGLQAAEALDYAHQNGTLHRDIKPANLIVDTHGIVWVLDFGLAKSGEDNLTMSGDVVGTIRYMAPERFDGKADVRSDIYSLGLTLYELATLQYAFDAKDRSSLIKQVTTQEARSLRSIDRRVPRDLETIILKSLDRNPNRRYQTSAEMAEDLRLFIMDHPIAARRISPIERAWRVCRRNPVVATLATTLLALLVLIAIGSTRFAYISNQQKNQALAAERSTRHRRYQLNYQSAQAIRQSDQLGRRFQALAAIREAVELLPTLDLTPSQFQEERSKLRTEAAAALGLFDIQPSQIWSGRARYERVVAFSSDHSMYARAFGDGEIRLIGVEDDEPFHVFHSKHGNTYSIEFSSDNKFLLSKNQKNGVTWISLWQVPPRKINSSVGRTEDANLATAATFTTEPFLECKTYYHGVGMFSKDATTFGVGLSKSVAIYDLPSGQLRTEIPLEFAPKYIQLSGDGKQLAVCRMHGTEIEIFDAFSASSVQLVEFPEGVQGTRMFIWDTERNFLIAGLLDGDLLLWRHGLDAPAEVFPLHKHTIVRIHLHPTQPRIFTQGWDETVRVFDLITQRQICRLEGFALMPSGFSSDGSKIGISSIDENQFGLWELSEPCLKRFRLNLGDLPAGEVYRVALIHPMEPTLLLSAHKNRIAFYDTTTQKLLDELTGYDSSFMKFTSDGKQLLIFAPKSSYRIPVMIARENGELQLSLGEPEEILGPLKGASRFVLTSDESGVLVVFQENSNGAYAEHISLVGDERISFKGHQRMTSAAISPDGKYVATSTWRGQGVCIWDAESGELKTTLLPEVSGTNSKFSLDGAYLVTAQLEKTYVWKVGSWEEIKFGAERKFGIMGEVEFTDSLFVSDSTRYVPQLVDLRSGRWLMHLDNNTEDTQRAYGFSVDGSQLAVGGTEFTHLWDLQQVRTQLTKIGLGW